MTLTVIETDPCSNAQIPRRIPDDFPDGVQPSTDFGSRGTRRFEIRSTGTAPLTVESVGLSREDPEYTLSVTTADEIPMTLPTAIAANRAQGSLPGMVVNVAYQSADAEPDDVELVVKTDDPRRSEVRIVLAAGLGQIKACVGDKCGADAKIVFGDVSRGASAKQTIHIENVGRGDLDLRDLKLESGSAEFCAPQVTSLPDGVTDCPLVNLCKVLRPGEPYDIEVTYTPVDGGRDEGVVKISSGDSQNGTIAVPIEGNGAGPAICVCMLDGSSCVDAGLVDFGAVDVGGSSSKTVRLVSCGTEAVDLGTAELERTAGHPFETGPEFSIETPFRTGVLPVTEHSEGVLTYRPAAPGDHKGALRYATNGGASSWIPLRGRAATCDLEALPANVNFGTVAAGGSLDRRVTLTSIGAKECTVTALTDPTGGFAFVNKPTLPFTVASGVTFDLTIRYTAPQVPTPQQDSSSFNVTSNEPAPSETNHITLVAQGGGTPVCVMDVQPVGNAGALYSNVVDGVLSFGSVNIGYSKTLPIRLQNVGNTDCQLLSFQLTTNAPATDMAATARAAMPITIQPGVTENVDVTFSPTQLAANPFGFGYTPLRNSVAIELSGAGLAVTSYKIGISANAVVPSIDLIPNEIDFGLVTWNAMQPGQPSTCGSETRDLRIYNSGSGSLEITTIRIDATSDPQFSIVSVRDAGGTSLAAPYAMSIPAGGNAEVSVRFFPTRINPPEHSGLLVVENNVTTESTVPLHGTGTPNSSQTDNFAQLSENKVDILWVVDDSGSMDEEQNALATNFQSFVQFADSLGGVDYQLGVTTTEINDPVGGDLWACSGYNKVIKSSDANREAAFQCASRVTNPPGGNRRPNPGGSDEAEAGLQAARLALDHPTIDNENAGFLRDDARLAVIMVSDEEDQSPGSVSLYVDFFRNIKGFRNPQLVQVSAIAGPVPGGCATAEAGTRYRDAVGQLNGQFESICTNSWSTMLANMGLDVFALREAWSLSRLADGTTVVVRVNGSSVPQDAANGWTYDPASNSIDFHGDAVPDPGSRIDVQYGALCLP